MMYSRVHGHEDKIGAVHVKKFGSCMELESFSTCEFFPLSFTVRLVWKRCDNLEEGI